MIDAGHDETNEGAEGPTGLKEHTVTLKIAQKLKQKLSALPEFQGSEGGIIMMRESNDVNITPKERATRTACCEPHLFLSIHCNSNGPEVRGTETFTTSEDKETEGATGPTATEQFFAEKIQEKVHGVVQQNDRGVKEDVEAKGYRFQVLRHEDNDATDGCLCEVDFITNAAAETQMQNDAFLGSVAEAIKQGIKETFDHIDP